MIRRPPRSTQSRSSAASDVYKRQTRMTMRKLTCRHLAARPAIPIWSCSRWGLPCRVRCRPRGALLPHPFTLTRRPKRTGGLLSVALSLGSPPPGVTRHLSLIHISEPTRPY
eukprot:TRINITY_DN1343_c0_g2_i4.p2 TRINITY_DN1343_c0_g2~~TRINITY_DN1343_c0_g2_i4.p2  ORF type:complete len:112 (-),score=14.97 TRINITY_DN1343_c0_g2_i4:137-472(-)